MNSYERLYLMLTENETVDEGIKTKLAGLALAVGAAFGGAHALKPTAPKSVTTQSATDAMSKPMFSAAQKSRIDKSLERLERTRKLRADRKARNQK